MNCIKCGKPLPSVNQSRLGASGLLCYEHFLETDDGRRLLSVPYVPPEPKDTGAGGPGRYIDQIHFHHSASESGNAASFRYYHSVILGWGDIAYHAVVTNGFGGPDGEVQFGKDDSLPGFSVGVSSLNARCLAICYVGNFSPGRYPTPKQWSNGVEWMRDKSDLYAITPDMINGHRYWNNNSKCPGFEESACVRMVADIFSPGSKNDQEEGEEEMIKLVRDKNSGTIWVVNVADMTQRRAKDQGEVKALQDLDIKLYNVDDASFMSYFEYKK